MSETMVDYLAKNCNLYISDLRLSSNSATILPTVMLCGVESQGMILAADAGEDEVKVIFVDGIPAGSKIR